MRAVGGARHRGQFLGVLGPGLLRDNRKLVDRADILHSGLVEAAGQHIIGEGLKRIAGRAPGERCAGRQGVLIEQTRIVDRLEEVAPGGKLSIAQILLLRGGGEISGEQAEIRRCAAE